MDVRRLENNFKAAGDEYLVFCERRGEPPDVPFKGRFHVRIPQDLHQRAAMDADEHDLKPNAVVQFGS